MLNNVCSVCGGHEVHKLVTYTQWYEGRLVIIENVPAWVCEQCGEIAYEPDVVDRILNVIWSGAEPVRVIEAPVYDLGG